MGLDQVVFWMALSLPTDLGVTEVNFHPPFHPPSTCCGTSGGLVHVSESSEFLIGRVGITISCLLHSYEAEMM